MAGIAMFLRIRSEIPMFAKIGPEFQCLRGRGQNTIIWLDRAGIPMFEKIGTKF